jgi:hypothetical protein
MELLPAELRGSLPALYSQERNPDPRVHLKFFTPDSKRIAHVWITVAQIPKVAR